MIIQTSLLDDLANSSITGIILFFIGLLIFYLFVKVIVKIYLHKKG